MNKFRVNLHPAFFDTTEVLGSSEEKENETSYNNQLEGLWQNTWKNYPIDATACFSLVMDGEKENYRGNEYAYNAAKENFQLRCKQPKNTPSTKERKKGLTSRQKEELKSRKEADENAIDAVWNWKLQSGFWHLIKVMKEKNRLITDGESETQDGKKKRTVFELEQEYRNEITQQLRDKVRYTSDKQFDKIKNDLFSQNYDYPANKVFCKLTWAKSIFDTASRAVRWISTSTVDETTQSLTSSTQESEDGAVDISERQQRNFLSDNVPNFLWNIRNTPWILKTLSRLPIFSFSEDRPSEIDKQAINNFLKVASRIRVNGGWDSAFALFNFVSGHDVEMDDWPDEYKEELTKKGMSIDDKYLDDLVNVWYFFKSTQNETNAGRNQHAIYLSVLQIIYEKKWAKGAVNYLKPLVDKYEEDKAKEKAKWYKSGEALGRAIWEGQDELRVWHSEKGETQKYYKEYNELATKLGISNLESVTRLAWLKMKQSQTAEWEEDYFAKNDEITILANLNNDDNINASDVLDWWTNTWLQFIDICKRIGKDRALNNLIERAKLENQVLGLWLNEKEINQESIKQWNIKVILLLQNIISKPGEDLYDLLSWKDQETRKEKGKDVKVVQLEAEEKWKSREQANEVAKHFFDKEKELIEAIYGNKNGEDVDNVTNIEDLQASLAMCLYDTYRLGIGAWATLSLDEWANWLEINAWLQVRDNKTAMLWLSISYERTANLRRGWTLTPALSAWAFLPILSWNKDFLASTWLSVDLQKKKVNLDKSKVTHSWFKAWVNFVPTMGVVIYWGYHHNYDKREGAETFAEYESFKIEKLLNEVLKNKTGALKLASLKEEIHREIAKTSIKDKEKAETDILRILEKYEWVTLDKDVKYGIILWVKEQYNKIRFESHKSSLVDTSHVGWRSAWAFLGVGGVMPVGVYWTIDTNTYYNEWYSGETWSAHRIEGGEKYDQNIDENIINNLNSSLGLKMKEEMLQLKKDAENNVIWIFIPELATKIVKLSEDMKWKVISTGGGMLVSQRTTMRADVINNGGVQSSELYVWQWPKFEVYLDKVAKNTERVSTNVNIAQIDSEILKKRNADMLKWADFKGALEEAGVNKNDIDTVVKKINDTLLDGTDKKLKIIITKKANDDVDVHVTEKNELWSHVEILYSEERVLFDEKAKEIADQVYAWAATLDNPYYLHEVKHNKNSKIYDEYDSFDTNLKKRNYEAAKNNLKNIISRLNENYPNNPLNIDLNEVSGEALGQLLMSIHNVFARARDVRWAEKDGEFNKYEFKRGTNPEKMWDIIARRENHDSWIWNTIHTHSFEGWESDKVWSAYEALIDAFAKERKGDTYFDDTSAVAKWLNNTVWCNLWDKDNPERLLLNPEVYNNVIDLSKLDGDVFTSDMRKLLHERMMRNFVENSALSAAIRNKAEAKPWEEILNIRFNHDWDRGTITLDIWDKKNIKLSADMKLGFFTQCVNHTLILDNISINVNWKETPFGSDAFDGTNYRSWQVTQDVWRSTFGVGAAITASKRNTPKQGEQNTEVKTEWGVHNLGPTGSTTPTGTDETTDPTNTGTWTNSWNPWWRPWKK